MYSGPWKVPSGGKRAKKDPEAPKRPMSAFLDYSKTFRSQVIRDNPHVKDNKEISRILGDMWRNASEEERKPFVEKELRKRAHYNDNIKQWRDKRDGQQVEERRQREATVQEAIENGTSEQLIQDAAFSRSLAASTSMPSSQLHSEGPSHFTFSGDYSTYQNSVDQHLSASFGHQATGDDRTTDRTSSFGAQGSYFHNTPYFGESHVPYNPDPYSGNWPNYNYHNTIYHPSAPSLSSSSLYSNLNIYSPVSNSRRMHPGEAISRGYELYDHVNRPTPDPSFLPPSTMPPQYSQIGEQHPRDVFSSSNELSQQHYQDPHDPQSSLEDSDSWHRGN